MPQAPERGVHAVKSGQSGDIENYMNEMKRRGANWLAVLLAGVSINAVAMETKTDGTECAAISPAPASMQVAAKDTKTPVSITADQIEFPKRNVVRLRGYTQLIRGGHRVSADELTYDKTDESVEARGVVKLQTPKGDIIKTGVLHYDVETSKAESGPADFVLATREPGFADDGRKQVSAHGTADRVELEGETVMVLEGVKITTCLDGKNDMTFTADSLKIDMDEGLRVAKRAKVQILAPDRHPEIKALIN